jgi:DNA modification methylase
MMPKIGDFELNRAYAGDCLELSKRLPTNSIDLIVPSPPYWGQRLSTGVGVEEDPREYLAELQRRFLALKRVLKPSGLLWINLGDAYNTPVNWTRECFIYSTLGPDRKGFHENNVAYTKPRLRRKAFVNESVPWLQYGNLLALPYRLVIALCEGGYLFRGEAIWKKANPMPEGKCRRPHRAHESVYLFAKNERHAFQVAPPVKTVWEFANAGLRGVRHFSRFPIELPKRCIEAYGSKGPDVVVLDPYSGSATTGIAAIAFGCSYIGFEIDEALAAASTHELAGFVKNGRVYRAPKPRHRKGGPTLFET